MIREYELPVFTFGWELEATGRAKAALSPDIMVGHDGSVGGDALEYRTRREAVWNPERSLFALRNLVMDPALKVDRSCGFHVHVGLGMKTRKLHSWAANFVTLARLIEDETMAVVPESRRENSYCRSWKDHHGSVIAPTYHSNKHSNNTRYCWVNPVEIFRPGGIRTIEIRLMGHSKNYLYLLAWTSFCRRMAASAWALIHDPSRLEQEVLELKDVLRQMRACFITQEITGTRKAQTVVMLAARAGFYTALAPSLKRIQSVEREIRYALEQERHARDEYNRQIEHMRAYLARESQSVAGTHADVSLTAGDTVEVLTPDPEGYTTVGTRYIVRADSLTEGMVQLRRGESGWWVPRDSVRFIEGSLQTCAV